MLLYGRRARASAARSARTLRELGGGHPEHPWATLVLAHATVAEDASEAVRLYRSAADGFARAGAAEGEVLARRNLRDIHYRRGDPQAAKAEVVRALAVAEASQDPLALARASVLEASHLIDTGGDLGHAHRSLLRAQRFAFPSGPIGLRRAILFALGSLSLSLGRLDDVIEAFERHRALQREDGAVTNAAAVAFNLLNARLTQSEEHPQAGARDRLVATARETLAEVERLGTPAVAARTHRVLGELLRRTDAEQASFHLRRCLELGAALDQPEVRALCLWSLSRHEASRDPARADRLSREAVELALKTGSAPLLAFAWQARLRLVWQTLPEAEASRSSLEALAAIERLRANQSDETSRMALFGNWTRDYSWLAGRMLEARPPRPADAFEVGERLRARVLLERLDRAGLLPAPGADAGTDGARQAIQTRIVDTQRRLLSPALTNGRRREALEELRLLELEEAELATRNLGAFEPQLVRFAALGAVQQALEKNEALLWYSMAPWEDVYGDFGGGSWLLCATRHQATVHRMPSTVELRGQLAAFAGLLRARETSAARWAPAADRLGRLLLGPVIAALPSEIERLTIVSDDVLHRLPFEALRPSGGAALGERFEVSLVPSATTWLHLRGRKPLARSGAILVLADPEVPRGRPTGELRLEPLPWARREAHAIATALGSSAARVREGGAASEQGLKETALAPFSILHFAAHALADDAFPERSAVFLAPGNGREDGWLQPREIGELDLQGRVVVLSACESADGPLLSGEGPLSLARAFFAGGAHAVVGTRWPLRDDDAAAVFGRFYEELASGITIGDALRRTRRHALAAGLPASAWASLVVVGDAGSTPVARRTGSAVLSARWWLAATLLFALALLLPFVSRRTSRAS